MNKKKVNPRVIAIAFALFLIVLYLLTNAFADDEIPQQALSYRGVPGYFGYWYEPWDDKYYYQEWGTADKKPLPDMSLGNVWLENVVVTTINVPVDKLINRVVVYKSTQDDTGMTVGNPDDMKHYTSSYSNVRHIEQARNPDGTVDVDLVIDLLVLSIDDAQDLGSVYKTYIHFVVEYVDKLYIENPPQWWLEHGGNPDPDPDPDPGTGDILVYVWHKEKGTEKSVADLQKVRTSLGKNLVLSGLNISGYKCVSSKIKGLATKEYDKNYIDEVIGRYDYTTPQGQNLDVTFYYEKSDDKPSDNWCDPDFRLEAESATIKMKRSEFEKLDPDDTIYFPTVKAEISQLQFGLKDGIEMPGQHGFESWDIYVRWKDRGYDFQRTGLHNKREEISLSVPKKYFTPKNEEKTGYWTGIEVTAGLNCIGGGFGADKDNATLNIDIIENQPPEAYYEYSSVKTLPSGRESKVNNKAYIGKDVVIDNHCSDPNGLTDIDFARFNFKNLDDPSQVKSIKLIMKPWGVYEVGEYDLFDDTSIDFKQIVNGNLRMIFTNDDEWEVSVYVQDLDGANDMYTNIIKPEELSLKPTAVIKDTREYRYPEGQLFNGKQSRVIRLDSNDSYVASWLDDMDVIINHNNDEWKIEPLDGQDINCVKFEKDLNKITSGNILTVRYEPLDLKMIFKESGRYKISLQVTDTEGNVSDWAEQIVIIHEDLPPTVTANVNPKYYRDESGNATITIRNINMESIDLDNVSIEKIEYRYDSNNDGNFGNWDILSENSLATTDLGIYQFKLTVKENFGQETIQKHITDSDYKRGEIILQTEVDNIAPNITKFKIMRSE